MGKLKKLSLILLILLIICFNHGHCQTYHKAIIHAHDNHSDGGASEELLLRETLKKEAKCLVITNHLNYMVGKLDKNDIQHPNYDYSEEYFSAKLKPNFGIYKLFDGLAIKKLFFTRDTEVFTDIANSHILYLNVTPKVASSPQFKDLNWKNSQVITDFINDHDGIAILAHPNWAKNQPIPNKINLEFFNTKGYILTNALKEFQNAERIDLEIYCNYIKNCLINNDLIHLPSITGGCDVHVVKEELDYGHTYFLAEKPSIENLYQAIRSGQTYAVMGENFKMSIGKLNYYPSKKINIVYDEVKILGKFGIRYNTLLPINQIKIFRDGAEIYSKNILTYQTEIEINLTDRPAAGKHVYFIYSPTRMITSPIVFDVRKTEGETPELPAPYNVKEKSVSNLMPSISPNGQWVAFVNNQYGNNEIFAVNISSLKAKRLTKNSCNDTHPTWTPDSEWVIFQSDRNGKNDLWRVNINNPIYPECMTKNISGDCTVPLLNPYSVLVYRENGILKEIKYDYPVRYPSVFKFSSKIWFMTKNDNVVLEQDGQTTNYTNNNSTNILSGHIQNWLIYYTNKTGDFDVWFVREDAYVDQPIIVMNGDQKYTTGTFVGQQTWLAFESNHDHLPDNPDIFDIYLYICQTKEIKRLTFGQVQ